MQSTVAERRRARLAAAFQDATQNGLRLALYVRFAALGAVALWMVAHQPVTAALGYVLAILALFGATGALYVWLDRRRSGAGWIAYAFVGFDALLLSAVLAIPNPFDETFYPAPMTLRGDGFLYYFVLLGLVALTYSPWLVLWFGCASALGRIGAIAAIAQDPRVKIDHGFMWAPMPGVERLAAQLDPWFIDLMTQAHEIILLLVVSAMLAVVVWRSRQLVFRQAAAERARANLARHFSPTMVDELSETDEPLGATRRQDVAVLFVDIVGFTTLASEEAPERVIDLLRAFDARMEACVFAHRGTVDKYTGDGLMVTFGTPAPAPDDTARALRCACAMLDAIEALNAERQAAGEAPIRVGIGAHWGPVVMGDIGSERRTEFAVIGDTVNVASRLEDLTRVLRTDMLVSDDLYTRAIAAAPELERRFVDSGPHRLRGRAQPVRLWAHVRAEPAPRAA